MPGGWMPGGWMPGGWMPLARAPVAGTRSMTTGGARATPACACEGAPPPLGTAAPTGAAGAAAATPPPTTHVFAGVSSSTPRRTATLWSTSLRPQGGLLCRLGSRRYSMPKSCCRPSLRQSFSIRLPLSSPLRSCSSVIVRSTAACTCHGALRPISPTPRGRHMAAASHTCTKNGPTTQQSCMALTFSGSAATPCDGCTAVGSGPRVCRQRLDGLARTPSRLRSASVSAMGGAVMVRRLATRRGGGSRSMQQGMKCGYLSCAVHESTNYAGCSTRLLRPGTFAAAFESAAAAFDTSRCRGLPGSSAALRACGCAAGASASAAGRRTGPWDARAASLAAHALSAAAAAAAEAAAAAAIEMRPRSRSSSDAEAVAAWAPAVSEAASAAATSSGSGLGSRLLGRRRLLLKLGRHRGAGGGPSSMAASTANAGAQSSRGAVRKNPLHGMSTACMRDRCGGTLLPCSDDVERLRRELSSSCGRRSAFGIEGMWVVHTRARVTRHAFR